MVRFLLALNDDRRIDVHAEDDCAFRCACKSNRVKVVELLLTSGSERLPSSKAFAEETAKWDNFPSLDFWRMHWKNRPREARMVEWRATVEAQRGLGRIRWCCEEGRPLELDRSLHGLGAIRLLTRDDLIGWREVAANGGHDECVRVLTKAIAIKT